MPTFETVVKDYTDPLLRFLIRKTSGDRQLAQDILQETFISIWKQFDTIRWTTGNPMSLFKAIAYRRFADHYRKNRPAEFTISQGFDNSPQHFEVVLAVEDDPPHEISNKVQVALEDLSDDIRDCVQAVIMDGYTHKEVSQMYNVAIGTVLSRVSRGRRQLRMSLKNQGVE